MSGRRDRRGNRSRSKLRGWALGLPLLGLGLGCDESGSPRFEFVPEMVDSVPQDPLSPSAVSRDGRGFQAAPPGTISRAGPGYAYGKGPQEAQRAAQELRSPLATPTAEELARGEQVFQRTCSPCHGTKGQGDGPIIPRFPAPPPLDAPHARGLADGELFHILMRGQGLMPAHAAQVAPADRWRLVAFIRSLQQGSTGEVK